MLFRKSAFRHLSFQQKVAGEKKSKTTHKWILNHLFLKHVKAALIALKTGSAKIF